MSTLVPFFYIGAYNNGVVTSPTPTIFTTQSAAEAWAQQNMPINSTWYICQLSVIEKVVSPTPVIQPYP